MNLTTYLDNDKLVIIKPIDSCYNVNVKVTHTTGILF